MTEVLIVTEVAPGFSDKKILALLGQRPNYLNAISANLPPATPKRHRPYVSLDTLRR